MKPSVVLATRSTHKAREIGEILTGVHVLTPDDAAIAYDPAEEGIEAFDTFIANAHAKAAHFLERTGQPTIADDSGICVHALGGAPGVFSKRFSGRDDLDGMELDRANNEHLLDALANVPPERRSAHYTCAAVLHVPDGRRFTALGTSSGIILSAPRGEGGFGYDPLFLVPETGRTFGEMAPSEKHRYSHRARAFRALAGSLESVLKTAHR